MMRLLPLLALALALAPAPACGLTSKKSDQDRKDAVSLHSPEQAQRSLRAYVSLLCESVQSGADQIFAKAEDPTMRRHALRWKINVVDGARRPLRSKDLFSATLDIWILTEQYWAYFKHGQGKDLFGPLQPIAIETMEACRESFERIARGSIKEDRFEFARGKIVAFAEKNPIVNYFVREPFTVGTAPQESGQPGTLARMVGFPMDVLRSPFSALEGVGSDVILAAREISHVAGNIGDIVELLPEQTRWQIELLSLDLEESKTVTESLDNLERATKTVEDVAATARDLAVQTRNLPAELRREADALIDAIDAKQENLQVTLNKTEAAAAQLDGTIRSADTLAKTLDGTLQALGTTGQVWRQTLEVFYKLMDALGAFPDKEAAAAAAAAAKPDAAPDDGAPPFDINDYGRAAQDLTRSAAELRALLAEADRLVQDPTVVRRIDDVNRAARATVDHVTWRAILVLAAAAVLALAYRFVRLKLLPG